jgi:hypothetical protein
MVKGYQLETFEFHIHYHNHKLPGKHTPGKKRIRTSTTLNVKKYSAVVSTIQFNITIYIPPLVLYIEIRLLQFLRCYSVQWLYDLLLPLLTRVVLPSLDIPMMLVSQEFGHKT